LRKYAVEDRAVLDTLLDTARVAHVGLVDDDWPVVIPTGVARDGDNVILHGSTGSHWMRTLASGAPACVTVTSLEGLVVARAAFESSMHYRSAVVFGVAQPVDGDEKRRVLDVITDTLIPGRAAEVRPHSDKELAATQLLRLPIEHWSLKAAHSWPEDLPNDIDGPAWAGVVPMHITYDDPLPRPTSPPASTYRHRCGT